MKVIINRGLNFGTVDGVIKQNADILKLINQHLKNGTAIKEVDTETTLMYNLKSKSCKK